MLLSHPGAPAEVQSLMMHDVSQVAEWKRTASEASATSPAVSSAKEFSVERDSLLQVRSS
jgi:hypothetical protein